MSINTNTMIGIPLANRGIWVPLANRGGNTPPPLKLVSSFYSLFVAELASLRLSETLCNCIIECSDGLHVNVHRLAMTDSSKYVRVLIISGVLRTTTDSVKLVDIVGIALRAVELAYRGVCHRI